MLRMKTMFALALMMLVSQYVVGESTARAQSPVLPGRVSPILPPRFAPTGQHVAGYGLVPSFSYPPLIYPEHARPRTHVGHHQVSNIGERYRDWSTGRTNLPLARPWLPPMR